MHVLYVLSFIIERVGSGIKPHVGALTSYLPELWQQSEVYNMLRCAIVSTLIHLEKVNVRFIRSIDKYFSLNAVVLTGSRF